MDQKEVPLAELQGSDQKWMQSLDYWYRAALCYTPPSLSLSIPPPKLLCFTEENNKG